MSRENEAAGKKAWSYEDRQMFVLHQLVREANSFQTAERYSLWDEKGETFSLSYWTDYVHHETVLIPSGTPQAQYKLQLAIDTMRKRIDELRHSFGRYKLDEG